MEHLSAQHPPALTPKEQLQSSVVVALLESLEERLKLQSKHNLVAVASRTAVLMQNRGRPLSAAQLTFLLLAGAVYRPPTNTISLSRNTW